MVSCRALAIRCSNDGVEEWRGFRMGVLAHRTLPLRRITVVPRAASLLSFFFLGLASALGSVTILLLGFCDGRHGRYGCDGEEGEGHDGCCIVRGTEARGVGVMDSS